jgi:hypothetical protein
VSRLKDWWLDHWIGVVVWGFILFSVTALLWGRWRLCRTATDQVACWLADKTVWVVPRD